MQLSPRGNAGEVWNYPKITVESNRTPMNDVKGSKLFVNLSASQTRRLLKGIGYGVRKVQSAGKNQAVIIHTPTGAHLRELEAVFGDSIDSHLPEIDDNK